MKASRELAASGLAGLIVALGTFWAFTRGAHDFDVFHSAWRLVLEGKPEALYQFQNMPDRYLYAPGFAWLLAPLGLLPRNAALALWCLAKAGVIGLLVQALGGALRSPVAASLAVVFIARPLLIDFQYGQVNVFILGACVWALLTHVRGDSRPWQEALAWAALGACALAKVFPIPLLVVPWLLGSGRAKLWRERAGSIAGFLLVMFLPLVSPGSPGGLAGLLERNQEWRAALIAKGLPMESHNQSFAAFLYHYFSGEKTHVIGLGMYPVDLGGVSWLDPSGISLLSIAWLLIAGGILAGIVLSWERWNPLRWLAVVTGLLIVPSHLVWKPYFVMALPAAALALRDILSAGSAPWSTRAGTRAALVAVTFLALNFTTSDFLGDYLGARAEAASLLLFAHLALLVLAARGAEPKAIRTQ